MTLLKLNDEFLYILKFLENKKPNTLKAYKKHLNHLEVHFKNLEINQQNIQDYIQLRGSTLNNNSFNQMISILKRLFSWSFNKKKISNDYSVLFHSVKTHQSLIIPLSKEQSLSLKSALQQHSNHIEEEVLYYCFSNLGLRISEVFSLKIEHINLKLKQITILGKGGKTRNLPLCNSGIELFNNYLNSLSSKATRAFKQFSSVRQLRQLVYSWKSYIQPAIMGPLNPHRLRHSLATQFLQEGLNIKDLQKYLGHQHLKTTQHYTHINASDLKKALDKAA